MRPVIRVWISFFVLLVLFASSDIYARKIVRGVVRDAETGEPLSSVTVQVVGTSRGIVTDEEGGYVLELTEVPATIRVSHVGYATVELIIVEFLGEERDVLLKPVPYEVDETVVTTEDPALRIMREVIRRKRAWYGSIRDYKVLSYTRQTLYGNNEVIGIRESVAEIFWDEERGGREFVKSVRHTANVPDSMRRFATSAYLVNLYDDEVEILGQRFTGPTHPRALEHYLFELTDEEEVDGQTVWYIAVRPKRTAQFSLVGYVAVLDGEYAVVEARLQPNRRIYPERLETEHGLAFLLQQKFARFEPGVWLRAECTYEIDGRAGTTAGLEPVRRVRGVPTPRARLKGWTRLTDYQVNTGYFDYAFMTEREWVVEAPSSAWDKLRHTFGRQVPLTRQEERAYEVGIAPSVKALERHPAAALFTLYRKAPLDEIAPEIRLDPLEQETLVSDDFLKAFVANSIGILVDSVGIAITDSIRIPVPDAAKGKFTNELWANRVDAFHFGLRWKGVDDLGERTGIYAKGGYNTGSKRWFSGLGLRRVWRAEGNAFSGFSYRAGTFTRYASQQFSISDNSLPFLLSLDDYFDFYWSERWRVESGYRFKARRSLLKAGFNVEEHSSLEKNTDFNLLCKFQPRNGRLYNWLCEGRDLDYRPNPDIDEGRLHAVDLELNFNDEGRAAHRAGLQGEYSAAWMGSDFSFARLGVKLDGLFDNYTRRWFAPDAVRYRLLGGATAGQVPVQRRGALDASVFVYAPFGTFKTLRDQPYEGERYAALFWEQYWGVGPLSLLDWSDRLVGLSLHGASGRTWIDEDRVFGFEPRTTSGWEREVGVSLVLFKSLKLHVTRRLDRSEWRWGISFE